MKILVTGTAGFIGFHLAKTLIEKGNEVVGLDNINDYYSQQLKYDRLAETGIIKDYIAYGKIVKSEKYTNYRFIKLNLEDRIILEQLFKSEKFDKVCNLAAQAGVRYSNENPYAYVNSNVVGFINLLECCRHNNIQHLVYASSSSVYGNSEKTPFSEKDCVDYPISLYAATKKTNELMAHTYSYLYKLPTTGLRLFTVYGPWGRPDMAPMLFTKAIMSGEPIKVFNYGDLSRDFTYIDDVIEGMNRAIDSIPDKNEEHPYYRLFNIGNSQPVVLADFINAIENTLRKKAVIELYSMQAGDVKTTYADTTHLEMLLRYKPSVLLNDGILSFIKWYKLYFNS